LHARAESFRRSNQSEPARLRFRSHNDALDFARNSIQRSTRWLALHSLDFPKRYKEGNFEIVFKLRPRGCPCEYDLLFFWMPVGKEAL